MSMSVLALALYAVASAGGGIMAARLLYEEPSPMIMSILHFTFAASASIVLAYYIFTNEVGERFPIALALFGVTALGGIYMGSFKFRDRYPPKWLVWGHSVAATLSIIVLVSAIQ